MDRALLTKHASDLEALRQCIGLRLVGLARSRYIFNGVPDTVGDGDLELRFDGGRTIVLTVASDGESVEAEERELRLPPVFALDDASRCEWDRIDLSKEEPYVGFLDQHLQSVDAVVDHRTEIGHRSLAGWVLHFGDRVISYVNQGDEGRISAEIPPGEPPMTTLEDVGSAGGAG
jgi:hypothetical protein